MVNPLKHKSKWQLAYAFKQEKYLSFDYEFAQKAIPKKKGHINPQFRDRRGEE